MTTDEQDKLLEEIHKRQASLKDRRPVAPDLLVPDFDLWEKSHFAWAALEYLYKNREYPDQMTIENVLLKKACDCAHDVTEEIDYRRRLSKMENAA
ncbi:MAG: hypothetical protein AAF438_04975 [Pseudomonadota bacterium]